MLLELIFMPIIPKFETLQKMAINICLQTAKTVQEWIIST